MTKIKDKYSLFNRMNKESRTYICEHVKNFTWDVSQYSMEAIKVEFMGNEGIVCDWMIQVLQQPFNPSINELIIYYPMDRREQLKEKREYCFGVPLSPSNILGFVYEFYNEPIVDTKIYRGDPELYPRMLIKREQLGNLRKVDGLGGRQYLTGFKFYEDGIMPIFESIYIEFEI